MASFLTLPLELRNQVYAAYFSEPYNTKRVVGSYRHVPDPSLLR